MTLRGFAIMITVVQIRHDNPLLAPQDGGKGSVLKRHRDRRIESNKKNTSICKKIKCGCSCCGGCGGGGCHLP